jgi:hypothetical protein
MYWQPTSEEAPDVPVQQPKAESAVLNPQKLAPAQVMGSAVGGV